MNVYTTNLRDGKMRNFDNKARGREQPDSGRRSGNSAANRSDAGIEAEQNNNVTAFLASFNIHYTWQASAPPSFATHCTASDPVFADVADSNFFTNGDGLQRPYGLSRNIVTAILATTLCAHYCAGDPLSIFLKMWLEYKSVCTKLQHWYGFKYL